MKGAEFIMEFEDMKDCLLHFTKEEFEDLKGRIEARAVSKKLGGDVSKEKWFPTKRLFKLRRIYHRIENQKRHER